MKEKFNNLDGLRTIGCLCIIAMHILANAKYNVSSTMKLLVASWTHFVLLFLVISGFGMFYGYYEEFKNKSINVNDFYTKRYRKIFPFFITLIAIDIIVERSISHIIEGFAEATMIFGLLPNNELEVIGVSWTIGVIFLFYIIFPFAVYLFWTKRRAWISFIVSIILSIFCTVYFFTDKFVIEGFTARHNFLYCAPFFLGGALVYIYREPIKKFVSKYRWISLIICVCASASCLALTISGYNTDYYNLFLYLPLFLMWLIYSISIRSKILNNKLTNYISKISMEMYLSHMFIYRIIEKTNLLYVFGNGILSFIFVYILVIVGLLVFIGIWKILYDKINKITKNRKVN